MPAIAREAIGSKLRESLDRVVSEPVPERFLRLLDELERGGTADQAPEEQAEARNVAAD